VNLRKSGRRAAQWSADLKAKGVMVAPADTWTLRFVTHRHISGPDVDAAASAFASLWSRN
jgi:threonine aldolase